MTDSYRLASDRAPTAQLTLGLAVALDPPATLGSLRLGDRFVLEDAAIEGRLVEWSVGSAVVTIRRDGEAPVKTTWSLNTVVRRMRA